MFEVYPAMCEELFRPYAKVGVIPFEDGTASVLVAWLQIKALPPKDSSSEAPEIWLRSLTARPIENACPGRRSKRLISPGSEIPFPFASLNLKARSFPETLTTP